MRRIAWGIAVAVLVISGCQKEVDGLPGHGHRPGDPIRFGAESDNLLRTRTSYSGERETDGSKEVERINWIDGDKVRISCAQASAPSVHYADYSIAGTTKQGRKHLGTLTALGDGLEWGTANPHEFYAFYPSPVTSGVQSGIGMDGNVVTAVLPPVQSFATAKINDLSASYYADMNLAYMTAAKSVDPASEDDVTLSFTPIVTTFYVTVKNTSAANPMTLRTIQLSSAQDALTGTFKATLDADNNRTYTYLDGTWKSEIERTDANSVITYHWAGDPIPASGSVTVALFALPQNITELTLTVIADEGTSRLALKQGGNWLTFAGTVKHNLNNLDVPEWEYDIDICDVDDTPATLTYPYTAGDSEPRNFSVRSRKTNDNGAHWYPTPWKAQYWSDTDNDKVQDADEWFDIDPSDYPAWLLNINPVKDSPTTASYEGNHVAKMTAQTVQTHEETLRTRWVTEIDAAKRNVNGAYDKARVNLHWWNHLTHGNGAATTTANCYIVQGPGDYIFPMVYGNGIDIEFLHDTDGDNTDAYDPPGTHNDYLNHFHNHTRNTFDYLGIVSSDRIKDAWISRHGTTNTADYYGHYCTQVGVLWQDFKNGENVITNVGYLETTTYTDNKSDRYVTFSVGENISPGNALIYVKDTHLNVIAWTWHIWITDQDLSPVAMKNNSDLHTFYVQPVNLGWVDDSDGLYFPPRQGILRFVCVEHESTVSPTLTLDQTDHEDESISGWAPYFQWGRKDPIRAGSPLVNDEPHHIYYSIQNPDKFLSAVDTGQHEYDWSDNDYLNMWRYDYHKEGINTFYPFKDTAVEKSVYDPCPRGYKVPAGNTWYGVTLSGDPEDLVTGKGRYFPTASGGRLFFPALGYINGVGVLTDAGSSGMYWLDVPHGDTARNSYCLYYSASGINAPGYVNRAYGLSVRCEREDANTSM